MSYQTDPRQKAALEYFAYKEILQRNIKEFLEKQTELNPTIYEETLDFSEVVAAWDIDKVIHSDEDFQIRYSKIGVLMTIRFLRQLGARQETVDSFIMSAYQQWCEENPPKV